MLAYVGKVKSRVLLTNNLARSASTKKRVAHVAPYAARGSCAMRTLRSARNVDSSSRRPGPISVYGGSAWNSHTGAQVRDGLHVGFGKFGIFSLPK